MQAINHNIRLLTASLLALCLASYVYSTSAEAAELRDISKVNGGIRIDNQDSVGNASSVNGGIDVANGASAQQLETVNGGIKLGDAASILQAETVNGGIRVGRDVTVRGSLLTVNGGIYTEEGTVVEDRVRTVNGKIRLRATHVGADVKTSTGDIEITDGSVVAGDLVVDGNSSWIERVLHFNRHTSEIVIDASSRVEGDIHLYRKVDLRIDEDAEVGEILEHF